MIKFPIYMDNHATTPVDSRVLDEMLPYLRDKFGNVGSGHICGRDVRDPVTKARMQVAGLIGAQPNEILFTSGATESDNLAIKGTAFAHEGQGKHIITAVTEHKAVLDTCKFLEGKGFAVTYLPVDRYGMVDVDLVRRSIRKGKVGTTDRTILVSLMGGNNEVGTIHPMAEIGNMLRGEGVFFHIDAAQTAGKIPFNVNAVQADLASISAHKIYGPKGIGALYVRRSNTALQLEPQMQGGGQEFGLRSGTLAVPMIVALGKACQIAMEELEAENEHLAKMREALWVGLQTNLSNVRLNGHPTERLPGNLNVTFTGLDGEMLMLALKNVCCSATSACSAQMQAPSHVLKAIGLSDDDALASIRFGLGRFNTLDEVQYVVQNVIEAVKKLLPTVATMKASRSAEI